ncbi:MAG: hypothetical protein AB7P03_13100 [Kofleriaceae bacterium]
MTARCLPVAWLFLALAGCLSTPPPPACDQKCVAPQSCGGGSAPDSCGATYYVAPPPTGSDAASGQSPETPWATFAHALPRLTPGDALALLDGTYLEGLDIRISGEPGQPIAIRALNDGGALIDGEVLRVPCKVTGADGALVHDVVVEGLRCANGIQEVVWVNRAERVQLRRITAHDAGPSGNQTVFYFARSANLLLEDLAAWGASIKVYELYEVDTSVLRRCWGRWETSGTYYNTIVSLSGSSDNIVENCVVTSNPGNVYVTGFIIGGSTPGERNQLLGNVALAGVAQGYGVSSDQANPTSNRLIDSVSIENDVGLFQRSDSDLEVDRATFVKTGDTMVQLAPNGTPDDIEMNAVVRNSVLFSAPNGFNVSTSPVIKSFIHHHNNVFGVATPYTNTMADATELAIDPGFDEATYGAGTYLLGSPVLAQAGELGSRMGAQVIYGYAHGQPTEEPLWPWPMEDRIQREAGTSVTWEAQGGLWRTLEGVYIDR